MDKDKNFFDKVKNVISQSEVLIHVKSTPTSLWSPYPMILPCGLRVFDASMVQDKYFKLLTFIHKSEPP